MYLRTLISTIAMLLLAPAVFVVWADPYHVWHDAGPGAGEYSTNQRYETPGHIRRYLTCENCDGSTILIGTSVSENTTLRDLRAATGNPRAVRLVMSGSYPVEQSLILKRALGTGNVTEVWWEIYRNYAIPEYDQFPEAGTFPEALYNTSIWDDYSYLLNHSVVERGVRVLLGRAKTSSDIGTLNRWHETAVDAELYRKYNEAERIRLLSQRVEPRLAEWQGSAPNTTQPPPALDKFILPILDQWPDVRFRLFVPPVSLVRHGLGLGELLSGELALRKALAEVAANRDNVTLYGFDHYGPLVSDMAYYKDSGHYTAAVNRWMLERMVANDPRFVVTPENVGEQIDWIWRNAIEYVPRSSCTHTPERCGLFDPARHGPGADTD